MTSEKSVRSSDVGILGIRFQTKKGPFFSLEIKEPSLRSICGMGDNNWVQRSGIPLLIEELKHSQYWFDIGSTDATCQVEAETKMSTEVDQNVKGIWLHLNFERLDHLAVLSALCTTRLDSKGVQNSNCPPDINWSRVRCILRAFRPRMEPWRPDCDSWCNG